MPDYADLEIGLSRFDGKSYRIDLRFSRPNDTAEPMRENGLVRIPLDKLLQKQQDPEAYGRLLKESLFDDPEDTAVGDLVRDALKVTKASDQTMRLRLLIDRTAPELHRLRWETLRNLDGDGFLATNQNLLFSRYLYSYDWDRILLRAKRDLRALVVVANPQDLEKGEITIDGHTLAPIEVAVELERAHQGLAGVAITELASHPDDPGRVSLKNLVRELQAGYDIVYLVCHGALWPPKKKDQQPYIWLEDDEGYAQEIPGSDLVDAIGDLYARLRPALVVLASCQSGGTGTGAGTKIADAKGALAALGPDLARAGIPAVMAMQGDVRMDTVGHFMPTFFQELVKHGQIEQALAAARKQALLAKCPDWWMPVLFLRLRDGLIWYVPGFVEHTLGYDLWGNIIESIKEGMCTPVLGPGLIEFLAGSPHEIARRWAQASGFPLSPHSLEDLSQVSQYLAVGSPGRPRSQFLGHLKERLLERYGDMFPPNAADMSLEELAAILGDKRREEDPADPYRVLADLPFPIYISANPDNLLTGALRATKPKKDPQVEFARWKPRLEKLPSIYDEDPQYRPSKKKPLVYHLFGTIEQPRSLVLTEDEYFDYLMWVNRTDRIPRVVDAAWTENSLLFLGFQMSDWRFRVLLRSILNEKRSKETRDYESVAVQIQPIEGNLAPEAACAYLVKLFSDVRSGVYWGSAENFLKELWRRWPKSGGGV